LLWSVGDSCAVFELYRFATSYVQLNWVEISFRLELCVTMPTVQLIRTYLKEVRDWRMMADLLDVYVWAVLQAALISLAEDGV
jgi:hypothetical protein